MEEQPHSPLPPAPPSGLPLPSENEVTLGWLSKHIPLRWWFVSAAACGSVIAAAFLAGQQVSAIKSAAEVRERMVIKQDLERDIGELRSKKLDLEANITRLEVELEIAKMSPAEVKEGLRNDWSK